MSSHNTTTFFLVIGVLSFLQPIVTEGYAANWNPLPDTGQTKCYWLNNLAHPGVIPCPPKGEFLHGQDAQYNSKAPSYKLQVIGGERLVRDQNTGLFWQQRTMDINEDGFITSADKVDWNDADDHCSNLTLGGKSNWRIPTMVELESIVDYGRNDPAINSIFSTESESYYWTSSSYNTPRTNRWIIHFEYGYSKSTTSGSYYLRCVSGEQTTAFGPYVLNSKNTVRDQTTGLTWMRNSADIDGNGSLNNNDKVPWSQALAWCEGSAFSSHSDWRLPNIRELISILDHGKTDPFIDPIFTESYDEAWSSTTTVHPSTYVGYAWVINFSSGKKLSFTTKSRKLAVRCVRGGLSAPPPPPPPPPPLDSVDAKPWLYLLLK